MPGLPTKLLRGSALFLLLFFSFSNLANAVIETYQFSSSSLEERYKLLSAELRCPKCQNQNIADSNAPISQDLRKLLYKQLEAGATDEEILEFMVSRYGEFVRYKPRMSGVTLMLWVMPLVLLVGAIVILFNVFRGERRDGAVISSEEQQQLDDLFAQQELSVNQTKNSENNS